MPDEKRPLKVFLCHASQDKPIVRELSRRLVAEGWIDVWLDEKKLLPGHDWRLNIEEAVETSDIVIICLSCNSVSREGFVQKELRYAREIALEKPEETIFLIPLRLGECVVPRGLRFYQWADYFGEKKEETYSALLESLEVRRNQKLKIDEEERAERKKAEAKRIVEEKVEQERLALEKAEAEKLARLKAEQEHIARQKAEAKRIAEEETERERLAILEAENERIARLKAEHERIARQKAEAESIAKQKAKNENRVREKAAREQRVRLARAKTWARLKISLLLLSVLLLVGVLGLALSLLLPDLLPATNIPTPTHQVFATQTSRATKILPPSTFTSAPPTNIPFTPTPSLTPVPTATDTQAQDFFTDTFDGNMDNYTVENRKKGSDGSKMDVNIKDGSMVFDLKGNRLYVYVTYKLFKYTDVKVSMTAANLGKNNNNVTLYCRESSDGWYEFDIANNGLYWIYAYSTTGAGAATKGWNTMFNGGSTKIKQGMAINEYAASCVGDMLTLTINGTEVKTIRDTMFNFREGTVGFGVSSFEVTPILINVDEFTISQP
jgi:hypothetical protein